MVRGGVMKIGLIRKESPWQSFDNISKFNLYQQTSKRQPMRRRDGLH